MHLLREIKNKSKRALRRIEYKIYLGIVDDQMRRALVTRQRKAQQGTLDDKYVPRACRYAHRNSQSRPHNLIPRQGRKLHTLDLPTPQGLPTMERGTTAPCHFYYIARHQSSTLYSPLMLSASQRRDNEMKILIWVMCYVITF